MKLLCINSYEPKNGHVPLLPEIGNTYTVRQIIKRENKEDRVLLKEFKCNHYIGNISKGIASYPISWFIEV